jgi:hypothetical protein
MKLSKEKIVEKVTTYLRKRNDIEFAYLFGSFAIDLETPLSDIDIAVFQKYGNNNEEDSGKTKYNFLNAELSIESDLTQILSSFKFDVRSLNNAPIIIIGKIINEGKLLFYKDENFFYDYIELSRLKYMDYSIVYNPLFNERYENLLNDR